MPVDERCRVVEKALELLPYRDKTVTTPIDLSAEGKELDVPSQVIGVSIARAFVPRSLLHF